MRPVWKRLTSVGTSDTIPPILMKYEIGSSDYSIWITDLTAIWVESLDRKRIIQRSFAIDTSIDPSEGSDQLRLFLQSVQRALEQQRGTTLDLVQNGNDQKLLLRTYTPLPGSLKPLQWDLELIAAPQSTLTAELIVPMLSHQVLGNIERASLLQQLKEKDQVISKLLDKMQCDGTDLGRIFPGIASSKPSRPSSRQLLGKSIKGLDEFDEQQWRSRLKANAAASKGFSELVVDAFEHGLADLSGSAQIPVYNDWWARLRHKDSQIEELRRMHQAYGAEENLTQGEFQRQSTPPRIHNTPPHHTGFKVGDQVDVGKHENTQRGSDSTTDESDQGSQPAASTRLPLNKGSVEKSKPMGTPQAPSPMTSPSSPGNKESFTAAEPLQQLVPTRQGEQEMRDTVANFTDDAVKLPKGLDNDSKLPVDRIAIQESTRPKLRAKLGKIGGKSKAAERNEAQSALNCSSAVSASQQDYPLRQSAQDNGKKTGAESGGNNSTRIGRKTTQPQAPSPPRESSRDRANKKREQLKRELESKSNAGAKKKRKF